MKKKGYAWLAATLLVLAAGPAMAQRNSELTTGGRTIAGPGRTTIAAASTTTVYTHDAPNTDACATVVNRSRTTSVRVSLLGAGAVTVNSDVLPGATSTLCHEGVTQMNLVCLAETSGCSAQWRVDNN